MARATLLASPGLRLVVGFGGKVHTSAGDLVDLTGAAPVPVDVEIFAVDRPGPQVSLVGGAVTGLSGGPEALAGSLPLDGQGPLVALADGGPSDRVLVTDTLRRRVLSFGAPVGRSYGPTLPATVDPREGRPAGDVLPYPGPSHQTTLQLTGATSVTASSSAADPFALGYRGPTYGAASALDQLASTAWVADVTDSRPTLTVTYAAPVTLPPLVLHFGGLPAGVVPPGSVTVTTAPAR